MSLVAQAEREVHEAEVLEEAGEYAKAIDKHISIAQLYRSAQSLSSHSAAAARALGFLAEKHEKRAQTLQQALFNATPKSSRNRTSQNFSNLSGNQSHNNLNNQSQPQEYFSGGSRQLFPPYYPEDSLESSVPKLLDDKKYDLLSSLQLSQMSKQDTEEQERETRELEKERGKVEQDQGRIQVGPTDSILFDERPFQFDSDIDEFEATEPDQEAPEYQTVLALKKLLDLIPKFEFRSQLRSEKVNPGPPQTPTPVPTPAPIASPPVSATGSSQPGSFSLKTIPSTLLYIPSSVFSTLHSYVYSQPTSSTSSSGTTISATTSAPVTPQSMPTSPITSTSTLAPTTISTSPPTTISTSPPTTISTSTSTTPFVILEPRIGDNSETSEGASPNPSLEEENEILKQSLFQFRKEAESLLQIQKENLQKGSRLSNSTLSPKKFIQQQHRAACQCNISTNCCCLQKIRQYEARISDLEKQLQAAQEDLRRVRGF